VRLLTERKKNKSFSSKDLDILIKDTAADRKVDALWEQLEQTTQLVTSLPDDSVRDILRNFKLPVRFAERFVTKTSLCVFRVKCVDVHSCGATLTICSFTVFYYIRSGRSHFVLLHFIMLQGADG
jgi:hypothetical protein